MPRIAKLVALLALVAAGASLLVAAVDDGPGAAATTASAQAKGPVVLAFAGDIHFEGTAGAELASNPAVVLTSIAPVLRRADLAVVNLETAVTNGGAQVAKEFTFRAPPSAFEALRDGGVDVASMSSQRALTQYVEERTNHARARPSSSS